MVAFYFDAFVVIAVMTLLLSFILGNYEDDKVKLDSSVPIQKVGSMSSSRSNNSNIFQNMYERFHTKSLQHFGTDEHIWFILTTDYSLTQSAKLTKIAQALYPVRKFVTLVLVKTYRSKDGIKHLSSLNELLQRFSVPYVLLSNRQLSKCSAQKSGIPDVKIKNSNTRHSLGRLVGLLWLLQNSKSGVIMFANEDFTYYHRIFDEIRYTKSVTVWPIALDKSSKVGFSAPIVQNQTITGYFNQHLASFGLIKLELGGFAINLNYLRQKSDNITFIMNFVTISGYTNQYFGIPIRDVKALGNNGTQINVWRTEYHPYHWPKRIGLKPQYMQTNMPTLMKNFFGESMYQKYYKKFERTLDNKNFYTDYN